MTLGGTWSPRGELHAVTFQADVVAYLRWVPNSQHIRGRVGGGFGTLKREPAGDGVTGGGFSLCSTFIVGMIEFTDIFFRVETTKLGHFFVLPFS